MKLQGDTREKLRLIFDLAVQELKQDLSHFKTWHENSRLHEGALTFQVGRLLRNSGILFYPEIPIHREQEDRGKGMAFDGIAWEPHSKTGIIIESKYLFSGSIGKLVDDLRRMHEAKPLDRFKLLKGDEFQTGLILVHAFQRAIQEWWMSDLDVDDIPKRKKNHHLWRILGHVLQHGSKGGGQITEPDKNGHCFWMMWCLFPLACLKPIFGLDKSELDEDACASGVSD